MKCDRWKPLSSIHKLKYEKLQFCTLKCMQSVRLHVKVMAGSSPLPFSDLWLSCESLFPHFMYFCYGTPKGPTQYICEHLLYMPTLPSCKEWLWNTGGWHCTKLLPLKSSVTVILCASLALWLPVGSPHIVRSTVAHSWENNCNTTVNTGCNKWFLPGHKVLPGHEMNHAPKWFSFLPGSCPTKTSLLLLWLEGAKEILRLAGEQLWVWPMSNQQRTTLCYQQTHWGMPGKSHAASTSFTLSRLYIPISWLGDCRRLLLFFFFFPFYSFFFLFFSA